MDYKHLYDLYLKHLFIDLRLKLDDGSNQLTMDLHKIVLILYCPFFAKLLTFGVEANIELVPIIPSIVSVIVPDVNGAFDLIMSFYGQNTNKGSYDKWAHELAVAKCRDYFGMELIIPKLPEKIEASDYDKILDLCEIVGYDEDSIKILTDNLPLEYDLKTLSKELVVKMIECGTIHMVRSKDSDNLSIWNIYTGEKLYTFKQEENRIKIYLSASYKYFVTKSDIVCNIRSLKDSKVVFCINEQVTDVEFFHDKIHCAFAFGDNSIKIFDLEQNKFTRNFDSASQHTNTINYMRVDFKSEYLATGDNAGLIKIWDTVSGHCLYEPHACTSAIKIIYFSKDSSIIIAKDTSSKIKIWKIRQRPFELEPYETPFEILTTSFIPYRYGIMADIFYVAVKNDDKVYVRDIKSNELINTFDNATHSKTLFSSNALYIAIHKNDSVDLCLISTGTILCSFPNTSVKFSSDNKYFVAASPDHIEVFDIVKGLKFIHYDSNIDTESIFFTRKNDIMVYDNSKSNVITIYNLFTKSVTNTINMALCSDFSFPYYNENVCRLLEIIE